MSLALIVMDKTNFVMGADSAISTIVNGDIIRTSTNGKKIFEIENYIIYCCGNMSKINGVLTHIKENGLNNIESYLTLNCNENRNGFFDMEVVVYDKEDKTLNTFSQYNDFKNVKYNHPQEGVQILTSGYRTQEATDIAKKYFSQGLEVFDIYKNTYTDLICNGIGGNVVIYSTIGHMRMFPLVDNTKCINVIGMEEYYVNAEVLAGSLVLGSQLVAKSEEGIINIDGNLISVYNRQGKLKVALGEYTPNKFGLMLYSDSGDVLVSEDGLMQSYSDSRADNVDSSHPLVMRVFVPENTKSIYKAYLRFSLENFRAYSRGAKSSPSQSRSTNSGGYSSSTTDSSPSRSRSTSDGGGDYVSTTTDVDDKWKAGSDGHNHGIDDGVRLAVYGGTVKVGNDYAVKRNDGESYVTWRESGQHKHDIRIKIPDHDHDFTIPSHDHDFTIPSHDHTFTIPSHSHDIEYGIYESSDKPSGCWVYVNGKRAYGSFSSNQNALDITSFLQVGVFNEIKITSTKLGRIDCTVFCQILCGCYS